MKIFLDDIREAPVGWLRVCWTDEVIELIMSGEVTHLSLDHDLGDDERGTGYTCRALHAVMASHDFDFSPKHFRWNLPDLCVVAETLSPNLHVRKWVEMLSADLAFIDVDEMPSEDGLTIRERRHLIAAGIMVIRSVEPLLGVPPAKKSNFFVSGFRRNEKKWMTLEEKGE